MNLENTARLFFVPVWSLLSRFSKGEGALFALLVAFIFRFDNYIELVWTKVCFAIVALALMYAVNDIHDAPYDIRDPQRRSSWNRMIAAHQKLAFGLHIVQVLAFAAVCYFFPYINFPFLCATLLISFGYSFWAKKRPGIDFLFVFLWGPAYIAIFTEAVPPALMVNAGFMLAMNHAFQMSRDRAMDERNKIRTSAVFSARLQKSIYYIAAVGSIACFAISAAGTAAIFAGSCLVPTICCGFSSRTWLVLKSLQASAWLLALYLN